MATTRCTKCLPWKACDKHIPVEHYYLASGNGEASRTLSHPMCDPTITIHDDQLPDHSLVTNTVACPTCTEVATLLGVDLTRRTVTTDQCTRCGDLGHLVNQCTRRTW